MALLGERTKSSAGRPSPRGHMQQSHVYSSPFIGPQLPPGNCFAQQQPQQPAIAVAPDLLVSQDAGASPSFSPDGGPSLDQGKNPCQADADKTVAKEVEQELLPELECRWVDDFNGRSGRVAGLQNNANNCYMNSVLQCLAFTTPFANLCLRRQHSRLCRLNAPSGNFQLKNCGCAFCLVEERIYRHHRSDLQMQVPGFIINNLRLFAPTFKPNRQEDAHEFLRLLIEACSKACVRLHRRREKELAGGVGPSAAQGVLLGNKAIVGNGRGRNGELGVAGPGGEEPHTVVREIFGGVLQSQVKCGRCQGESNRLEVFMDLCLELDRVASVEDCLRRFTHAEVLDGDNKYACEKCRQPTRARKQITLLAAPNTLVIQLKRFMYNGAKVNTNVKFYERLSLASHMSETTKDPSPEYTLYGVIVHQGSSQDMGHYFAYIKDQRGQWHLCNDMSVSNVNINEVLREKAYMLFYARTNTRPMGATLDLRCGGSSTSPSANPAPPPESPRPPPLAPDSPSIIFATPAVRANGRAENGGPMKQPVRRGPVNGAMPPPSKAVPPPVNGSIAEVTASRKPLQARANGQPTTINGTVAKRSPPQAASNRPTENGNGAMGNGNGNGNGTAAAAAVKPPAAIAGLSPGSFVKGLVQAESEPFDDDDMPVFVRAIDNNLGNGRKLGAAPCEPGGPTPAQVAQSPSTRRSLFAPEPVAGAATAQVALSPSTKQSLFGSEPAAGAASPLAGNRRASDVAFGCQPEERSTPSTWPPAWMAQSKAAMKAEEEQRYGECVVPTVTIGVTVVVGPAKVATVSGAHRVRNEAPAVATVSLVRVFEPKGELGERCCQPREVSGSGSGLGEGSGLASEREKGPAESCTGLGAAEAAAEATTSGRDGGRDGFGKGGEVTEAGEVRREQVRDLGGGVGERAEAVPRCKSEGSLEGVRKRKDMDGYGDSVVPSLKRARTTSLEKVQGGGEGSCGNGGVAAINLRGLTTHGSRLKETAEVPLRVTGHGKDTVEAPGGDNGTGGSTVGAGLEAAGQPVPAVDLPVVEVEAREEPVVAVVGGVLPGLQEVGDGAVAVAVKKGSHAGLEVKQTEGDLGKGSSEADAVVPEIDLTGQSSPCVVIVSSTLEKGKAVAERGGVEAKSLEESEVKVESSGVLHEGDVTPALDKEVQEHLPALAHVPEGHVTLEGKSQGHVSPLPHVPEGHGISNQSEAVETESNGKHGGLELAPVLDVLAERHVPQQSHVPEDHMMPDKPAAHSENGDAHPAEAYVPPLPNVPEGHVTADVSRRKSENGDSCEGVTPVPHVPNHMPSVPHMPTHMPSVCHVPPQGHATLKITEAKLGSGGLDERHAVPPALGLSAPALRGHVRPLPWHVQPLAEHVDPLPGHVHPLPHVSQEHVSHMPQVQAAHPVPLPVAEEHVTSAPRVTQGHVTILGRVQPKEAAKKRKKPQTEAEFSNSLERRAMKMLLEIGWCERMADSVHFARKRKRMGAGDEWGSAMDMDEQLKAIQDEYLPKLQGTVPDKVKKMLSEVAKKWFRSHP